MLVGNVEGGLSVLDYYSVSSCAVDVPTWGIPVSKKQLQVQAEKTPACTVHCFRVFERKFSGSGVLEVYVPHMCPSD